MASSTKSVLLLKAASSDSESGNDVEDPYRKELSENGFNVTSIPVIEFANDNLDELEVKLLRPESYTGIVFTSRRSVESVKNVKRSILRPDT